MSIIHWFHAIDHFIETVKYSIMFTEALNNQNEGENKCVGDEEQDRYYQGNRKQNQMFSMKVFNVSIIEPYQDRTVWNVKRGK